VFTRTDVDANMERYQFETKFENPERIKIILAEQAEFYKKFQAALTTPEEVLAKMKGHSDLLHKEIHVRSEYDLEIDNRGKIKSHVEFDGKTYEALRNSNLTQIRTRLEQHQTALEKTASSLKEQAGSKVEADWAESELSSFGHENRSKYHEVENIFKLGKAAEQLSPRLDLAASQLQGQMDQTVSGHADRGVRYQLGFDSVKNEDLMRMASEIETLTGNIKDSNSHIEAIDRRARSEGDGFLGRKKKTREQEKAQEETKKQGYQTQLDKLLKEYQPKRDLDNKLGGVRSWLYNAQQQGMEIKLPSGSVTLRELIDNVKSQMNFTLTPEQVQIYERYQELEKKQKEKAKEYEKYKK
jgi:hypothetical protein